MHQVTVTDHHYDDGFDRSAANDRLLRGTLIGWTDTNKWADRDGMPPPETMIVIGVDEALQRWQCKKLVEVIRDKPLPNVNTLNEATDKSTWEIGLDNKPKAPWVHSFLVYLLDPATAATYTYVNSTYGAKLAYDILRERVTTMRLLRGARVVPLVKLDERPFRTSFGPRRRPEFTIVSWRMIGGGPLAVNGPQTPHLAKPDTASRAATTAPTNTANELDALPEVTLPIAAEEIRDEIRW
jgi:hypothetical protein